MNRSKIEWCDYTWNPVTGCLHGCPYCYAEKIALRFSPEDAECNNCRVCPDCPGKENRKCPEYQRYWKSGDLHVLDKRVYTFYPRKRYIAFPYGFEPTLHRYRLQEPGKIRTRSAVFVCSMADLFGEWVPDEWIREIFQVCGENSRHQYFFLTKNPSRYLELADKEMLPRDSNMFYGTTITKSTDSFFQAADYKTFLSIEPIQENFSAVQIPFPVNWVIVGQETGNRRNKIIAQAEWVRHIYGLCHNDFQTFSTPVFMKNNLSGIMEPLIQEKPERDE